jgi:hypothetical protein
MLFCIERENTVLRESRLLLGFYLIIIKTNKYTGDIERLSKSGREEKGITKGEKKKNKILDTFMRAIPCNLISWVNIVCAVYIYIFIYTHFTYTVCVCSVYMFAPKGVGSHFSDVGYRVIGRS